MWLELDDTATMLIHSAGFSFHPTYSMQPVSRTAAVCWADAVISALLACSSGYSARISVAGFGSAGFGSADLAGFVPVHGQSFFS